MITAVLWDLDGTLVDSAEYHWLAWRDTMRGEGMELGYQQFLDGFGQKNDRILTHWLGERATPDVIRRVGHAKEAIYRELAAGGGLSPLPGAAEWVARLHRNGWRQAVASSAPAENVRVMLRVLNLDRYFDAVTAAEDVTAGKPDPQVFLKAAAKLHAEPSASVVVEDAAAGIEAAKRAGMKCVGVSRAAVLPADVFVRSLAELPPDTFERLVARPI
ncbi:MAG TPA: HAD family phosphatase [Vicinamibacterales bacterium]|nr:HAD family phosphatase [Vicinamibacterales bacterium]